MSYTPPVYDDAVGVIHVTPQQQVQAPPPLQRRPSGNGGGFGGAMATLHQGVSRGTTDEYQTLGNDDDEDELDGPAQRANTIALKRQQQHADAFKRQIEAEEDYLRSSSRQVAADAELARRYAEEGKNTTQSDAHLAAELQRRYEMGGDEQQMRPQHHQQQQPGGHRTEKHKVVRVKVPQQAKPGDMLVVTTPSSGKFEVSVPGFAPPGTGFDCHVTTTTIVEVRPPRQQQQPVQQPPQQDERAAPAGGGYQPPSLGVDSPAPTASLPPGWERGTNKAGEVFYVDHNTRTTHWEAPKMTPPTTDNPLRSPARPPSPPLEMTEEEMLAEAIARSLADSQIEEAAPTPPPPPAASAESAPEQPTYSAPPPPPAAPPAPAAPAAAPAADLPNDDDLLSGYSELSTTTPTSSLT